MFTDDEHKFKVLEYMFVDSEHKFIEHEYKIVNCMKSFVLRVFLDKMTSTNPQRVLHVGHT